MLKDSTGAHTGWMPSSPPSYVEVAPPAALADLVASLWEMRLPTPPTTADQRVRILPNACVDVVVYAGDTSRGEGAAAVVAPPHRGFVVGSTLRSFVVRSAGARHIVGASLLPAGVRALLGVPARVVGDRIAPLDDLLGPGAADLEDRVVSAAAGGRPGAALAQLGDALLHLRASRDGPVPAAVVRAVHAVRTAGGRPRVDALARAAHVSTRQLERAFREHVGVGPKTYARLVRFDRAARGVATRGALPWSQFALAHGYSDQAHLINEFRAFADVPPAAFERERSAGGPPPAPPV